LASTKHITVAATLTYGEGRNDFTREIALLEPDQITLEARFISTKTVYSFEKDGGYDFGLDRGQYPPGRGKLDPGQEYDVYSGRPAVVCTDYSTIFRSPGDLDS
jgi:hypothetical protein